MNKEEKKTVFELNNLLCELEVYTDKMDFCNTRLMELSELCEYSDYEEQERPLFFWNARERIEKYVEIQNDYFRDKVLPLIEKAQEIAQALMDGEQET